MEKLPFDLEKAKAGAKVVTRNGYPARIVCWDRVMKTNNTDFPIIALVDANKGSEICYSYQINGRFNVLDEDSNNDLFILEEQKLRPYTNAEEFLGAMKEHGPMVRSISDGLYFPISRLDANEAIVRSAFCTFRTIKDIYTWQDGSPCGVEEGGDE